jgi:imidazolonepropionase-like amidohydrolase
VGCRSDFSMPDGAEVIDAGRGTILPGIINAHVHHSASPEQRRLFLEQGITSVGDLGAPKDEIPQLRQRQTGDLPGARVFYAGPIVTAPGGYPDGLGRSSGFNYEISTPGEAHQAVSYLIGLDVDFVKIALDPSWNSQNPLPMLDLETVRAIVQEAHNAGLLVRAHMIQMMYFNMALDAGIDVIEHMPFPPGWPPQDEIERLLESEDPLSPFFNDRFPEYHAILNGMADRGVVMVPTVSALLRGLYPKSDPTPHERFVVMAVFDMIRRFRDAGGVIALGNDFNDRFIKERFPITEMKALLEAGLTPQEVIEAGTRHAARVCGQEATLGTLEEGKLADIIIVDGNPLKNITALTRLKWIILDGKVVHHYTTVN